MFQYRGIGYGASCYALRDALSGATPVSWQLAQSACQTTFGGQLATVNDRWIFESLHLYYTFFAILALQKVHQNICQSKTCKCQWKVFQELLSKLCKRK